MRWTRENIAQIPSLSKFENHLNIIENSVEATPSLCVEMCKSFTEAVCKTILNNQAIPFNEDITFQGLVKTTVDHLIRKSEIENIDALSEMSRRISSVSQSIAEVRNNAGFASHGQDILTPDVDKSLSLLVYRETDVLVGFILYLYLNYAHKTNQRMLYDDYPEFNDWFDEANPLEIGGVVISASEALYNQDYEAYKQSYTDYLLYLEETKSNKS